MLDGGHYFSCTSHIYKSRQKTGDYHVEMGIKIYACWLKIMIIPNLSPNSMHLPSFYNIEADELPTPNSKKGKIKSSLLEINIPSFDNMVKAQLYDLIS
jgi:hypothetical protein